MNLCEITMKVGISRKKQQPDQEISFNVRFETQDDVRKNLPATNTLENGHCDPFLPNQFRLMDTSITIVPKF